MPLCDLDCRQAKPEAKAYRLFDGGGLYLDVKPSGTKIWRFRYKFHNQEKLLTIGRYPNVSLFDARVKHNEAKKLIENFIDPAQHKQDEKKNRRQEHTETFEYVAREWHQQNYDKWSPNHAKEILHRLETNVFPLMGQKPIKTITVQDVLFCIRRIEKRKAYHVAKRILQTIGQIMRYAVITGRIERDITFDLKGAVKKYQKSHYAAIDSDRLPELLNAINLNDARLYRQTILGIKLLMYTFVRTSELINATWDEFDLEKAVWHIPGKRMKMRKPHVVPLSRQVIAILSELSDTFGKQGFILPSIICSKKPISNNTILHGLGRLGFKKIMTGHGFRALAMSTIKEKLGYRHEVVDRQLAHIPRSDVDQAYDRASFLPDRVKMMQEWADYISSVEPNSQAMKGLQGISLYHSFSMPLLADRSYTALETVPFYTHSTMSLLKPG